MASGRFAVLHRVPQRHVHQQETAATATCHRAVEAIDLLHHGLAARAAVGDVATSVAGLHDSYQDACDALRLGARVAKDLPVHTIGDLRIHQVLAAVGHRTRAHLVDLVVGPLRAQPDWPVLRRTIVAWCEHGFNLVRASAALYIHRNTLVYRLGKIEDVGGRSLRDHRASMAVHRLPRRPTRRAGLTRATHNGGAHDRTSHSARNPDHSDGIRIVSGWAHHFPHTRSELRKRPSPAHEGFPLSEPYGDRGQLMDDQRFAGGRGMW